MPEEKGHAKNIANFAQIITILNSLGAAYNPSNALVKLPALNAAYGVRFPRKPMPTIRTPPKPPL